MKALTSKVYLPWGLYRLVPFLYILGAGLLWAFVDHGLAKLLAAALVVLALFILIRRFSNDE